MILSESLTGSLIGVLRAGLAMNLTEGGLDGVVEKIKNIKIIRYMFILSLYRFYVFRNSIYHIPQVYIAVAHSIDYGCIIRLGFNF